MEKSIPVETVTGYILYNDALHLEKIVSTGVDWHFTAKLNGFNVTKNPTKKDWFDCEFTFQNVNNFFYFDIGCEPDVVFTENPSDPASFHIIENSNYIAAKLDYYQGNAEGYHHYRLKTTEFIFHIIAKDYELKI
ncbi:hypothetical protein LJB89_00930 [Tyzzerella sp. OttesenSCG-928-J15]|nr:hypothetical protein [Tyzzerella sp. OttesenSCG-928-J15]MDL2248242.1 hypothetical protein [Tyzzerella sp. OttesenSCG-928-J15]